jgi:hypothetical protein
VQNQELVENYEVDLDNIQQEIDRYYVMQWNADNEEISDSVPVAYEEFNDESQPSLEGFDESLEEIVSRKYRFLLLRLDLGPNKINELKVLLLQREELVLKIKDGKEFAEETGITQEEIWQMEYLLEDIDNRIEQMLELNNSERYAVLKNSDEEQKQINQYTLGVSGLFPLDIEQQEKVLFVRLKHKEAFEKKLKAYGIDMNYPLTKEQRKALLYDVKMAALRYKHGFLMEVRKELVHDSYPFDQYTLLENYTNTEFKELLSDLNAKVAQRGVIN